MKLPKIVFLDRDGTINEEVNYLHKPEDFRFVPGVPAALRRLHEAGYLLIVITNQAGIARGYYSETDCEALNRYMAEMLAAQGTVLTAAYYCPHHPVHGIGAYRRECSCRKPKDGLFLQALADLGIAPPGGMDAGESGGTSRPADFHQGTLTLSAEALAALRQWKAEKFDTLAAEASTGRPDSQAVAWPSGLYKEGFADRKAFDTLAAEASTGRLDSQAVAWPSGLYMIGDKRIDTQAGHNFGICSILVGSGYGREEKAKAAPGDYDLYFDTLGEAAEWILKQEL